MTASTAPSQPDASNRRALRVAVSGASGLVGNALCDLLEERSHRVIRLVRREPRAAADGRQEARWSPERGLQPTPAVDGLDGLVHLAGESIAAGRWNDARKRAIRDSRVAGTRALVRSFDALERPPAALVCASATGYYGDRGDQALDESAKPGAGFLAEVCVGWEEAACEAEPRGVRVVRARLGVVLGAEGGALDRMLLPFKLGLGGRLGSGDQYLPWIALDDAARALAWTLEDRDLAGPVNVVAPEETSNRDLTRALGRVLHRPTILPVPALALRLALGREMADELLLASARVRPARLLERGFEFAHPALEEALRAAL
ncbi:MAG TPA: TIGR01777 family oxidoreductase [Thermoanaerobaculia bacterium]|nr:TIGR01777 family oxidoreductase [Thermoanaerobaculia bacterium]